MKSAVPIWDKAYGWEQQQCKAQRAGSHHWHSYPVRLLARKLPLGPTRRVHFQKELMEKGNTSMDEGDSSFIWQGPGTLSLTDIVWLNKDCGDPCIRARAQYFMGLVSERHVTDSLLQTPLRPDRHMACKARRRTMCYELPPPSTAEPTSESGYHTPAGTSNLSSLSFHPTLVSTPISASSASMTSEQPGQGAIQRISELEGELERLRKQVAAIVAMQEVTKTANIIGHSEPPGGPPLSLVPFAPPPPPPAPHLAMMSAPPGAPLGAPPPPPPPPPPPNLLLSAKPAKSVIDIIRETKMKKMGTSGTPKTVPGHVDMAEILKGIGNVKLRSIKRSPGGTPVRERPRPCDVNDPAAMIAQALKRKFAHRHRSSPDTSADKENAHSPNAFSKITPPGPHSLKGARKLFKRRSHPAQPLCNVNA